MVCACTGFLEAVVEERMAINLKRTQASPVFLTVSSSEGSAYSPSLEFREQDDLGSGFLLDVLLCFVTCHFS